MIFTLGRVRKERQAGLLFYVHSDTNANTNTRQAQQHEGLRSSNNDTGKALLKLLLVLHAE